LAPGESATLDELKARRASPGVINVKGGEAKRVYVGRSKQYGRPHYFANPYLIGEDGDREEVLEKYQEHLARLLSTGPGQEHLKRLRKEVEAGLPLACHCAGKEGVPEVLTADDPLHCHGQLILLALRGDFPEDPMTHEREPLLDDEGEL
jgi:hypothetical protein